MAKQPDSDYQHPLPAPLPDVLKKKKTGPGPLERDKSHSEESPSSKKRLDTVELAGQQNIRDSISKKKPQVSVGTGSAKTASNYTNEQGIPVLNPGRMVARFGENEIAANAMDEVDASLTDVINRNRHPLSSFLISMIVHTSLLIILALIALSWHEDNIGLGVLAEIDSTPVPDATAFDLNSVQITPDDSDEDSPLEDVVDDMAKDQELLTPDASLSLAQPPTDDVNPNPAENTAPVAPNQAMPVGGGLEGRDAEARARLASARGATEASEQAVELGIEWIIAHQHSDGSWRFFHDRGDCNGQCKNPGTQELTTAATGMALMSILGAGYTHRAGPYQSQVKAGLDYLVKKMRITKFGGNLSEGSMYAQGIATLALSEAYIMTKDPDLKEPVEHAMNYIVSAQHSTGGWRYTPGHPGDMTVTGWQMMALKSCQIAGIHPPIEILDRADAFISSLSDDSYQFGYMSRSDATPATNAIGLLMRLYLGDRRESGAMFSGAENLISRGPSRTDIYYDYYATLALHHLNSQHWNLWNDQMRDYLVRTQETRGHQRGSWYFPDKHGKVGGRLYTTAMAVMILEVYYRYMPLYDEKTILKKFDR